MDIIGNLVFFPQYTLFLLLVAKIYLNYLLSSVRYYSHQSLNI